MKRLLLLALPACLLVTGSRRQSTNADHYLDQFIDTTVSPRDDFFHYSVGKWLRDHPMPSSERAWGIYNVVQEETYQRLLGISQASARAKTTRGSNAQKIEDFYAASMDTITTAQLGLKPLAGEFARIAAIVDKKSLADVIARQQYIGVGPAYGLFIGQDEKKSDRYLVHLYQGDSECPIATITSTLTTAPKCCAGSMSRMSRGCSTCSAMTALKRRPTRRRS